MGLSSEEFWGLSPREFHLLAEEWSQEQKKRRAELGFMAAVQCNSAGAKHPEGRPYQPHDFFPDLKPQGREDWRARLIRLDLAFSSAKHQLSKR